MKESVTLEPPFVAFKEWHVICDALLRGEQHVILRKGGIAEGREGFAFQHRDFLLFPTFFHAQYKGVRLEVPASERRSPETDRQTVLFEGFCRMEGQAVVTDWETVEHLAPYHVWEDEVLRERFEYGEKAALHVAVVRTYKFVTPIEVPFVKAFGGCRSWVSIPLTPALLAMPVLNQKGFEGHLKEIDSMLSIKDLRD